MIAYCLLKLYFGLSFHEKACYRYRLIWTINCHKNSLCPFFQVLKMSYLVNIMNELVHLPKPCVRILILKISSHGPHYMIGSCYVCLRIVTFIVNTTIIITNGGPLSLLTIQFYVYKILPIYQANGQEKLNIRKKYKRKVKLLKSH